MAASDRWQRIGALFDAVLEKPAAEREALVRASDESTEVQREVLSLLASHDEAGQFLQQPAARALTEGAASGPPLAEADDEPPPLAEGTSFGPYRIIGLLGRGGMGVVYRAEDTRLHRTVALKLLSPRLAREERQRQRLKQEARAAAALTHSGIATVYALEEIDDQIAIASEYLSGDTLRAELDRGAFGPERARATAVEIACAMAAAHERGIVHRDLKPENILRTANGAIKILDFGLAQFDASARDLVSMTRLTQPGLVAGTPPYMAPEQLLGLATDFRTDHFAFGVMLYEMCSGRHPFGGTSLPSTIARILAGDPRPPQRDDEIPEQLRRIIDRCLQKDPKARFGATTELVTALASLPFDSLALAQGKRSPVHGLRLSDADTRAPSTPAPGTSTLGTPGTLGTLGTPFWWWQFHQLAAAVVYWAMVWPTWHVHRWIGPGGKFFFFATLAAVIVAANLRVHLWFSSRIYPTELDTQRQEVGLWIKWADSAFVALLVTGGFLLPEDRAAWATLFISVGIGTAVAFLVIEPGTARAAFGRNGTR